MINKGLQPYTVDNDAISADNRTILFCDYIIPWIQGMQNTRRALDVGCGNGRLSSQLAHWFREVVAIDPYDIIIEQFHKDNVIFEQTSFQDYVGEKFDLIMFWGSFYLVNTLPETYIKIEELLAPGGHVLIQDDSIRHKQEEDSDGYYRLDTLESRLNMRIVERSSFDRYSYILLCR